VAIKRARHLALLPYTGDHSRSTGIIAPPPPRAEAEAARAPEAPAEAAAAPEVDAEAAEAPAAEPSAAESTTE
jgi:hypothetical protein